MPYKVDGINVAVAVTVALAMVVSFIGFRH